MANQGRRHARARVHIQSSDSTMSQQSATATATGSPALGPAADPLANIRVVAMPNLLSDAPTPTVPAALPPPVAAKPRKPCLRMTVELSDFNGDISWAHAVSDAPPAPADAAAEPKGDAPPPPPRPRAFEAPNPGSRFDQMIKDMERKYATARPVQASKRAGRPADKRPKKKKKPLPPTADGEGGADGRGGRRSCCPCRCRGEWRSFHLLHLQGEGWQRRRYGGR